MTVRPPDDQSPGIEPATLNHYILLAVITLVLALSLLGVLSPTRFWAAMTAALAIGYIFLLRIHQAAGWQECPSWGQEPLVLENYEAQCPVCAWVFTTVMDSPHLPRHWIDGRGNVQLRPR